MSNNIMLDIYNIDGQILKLMSLELYERLPSCLIDIIYSYCAPDVQFVNLHTHYPKYIAFLYIHNLCHGNIWHLRRLVNMLNEHLSKIVNVFFIHRPFYFPPYADIFNQAFWLDSNPHDHTRTILYNKIKSVFEQIYTRIDDVDTCNTCRSVIYYYMRIIIMELVRQHGSFLFRIRSYTI